MIGRIVALVVMTLAYWLCAFILLGGMLLGDCFEVRACIEAKGWVLETGTGVAVALYLVLIALMGWVLFKRRAG